MAAVGDLRHRDRRENAGHNLVGSSAIYGVAVSSISGRSNTNERGSAADRRRRKDFLLKRDGRRVIGPHGELKTDCLTVTFTYWIAQCWECSTIVTAKTIVVDRIMPGSSGGTYRRNNIRVHCGWCSTRQGQL